MKRLLACAALPRRATKPPSRCRCLPQSRPIASPAASPSSRSPSTVPSWKPALPPGELPAYDAALAYLAEDGAALRAQARALRSRIGEAGVDGLEKGFLEGQADELEVDGLVNDPGIRSLVEEGKGDMGDKVVRRLMEKKWRLEGRLGRLMETVHRLRVFPDLLPGIQPTADLRVLKPARKRWSAVDASSFLGEESIEVTPGSNVSADASLKLPQMTAQVFHPEERLYTLLVVDPDVPDPTNQSFGTYLHLLVPNIPLSATSPLLLPLASLAPLQPWIPSHPAQGSPLHRYTVLLLRQPSRTTDPDPDPPSAPPDRDGFDVRAWVDRTGQDPVGVAVWTGIWTERAKDKKAISRVYRDILGVPEPRFGRPPQIDTGVRRRRPLDPVPLKRGNANRVRWQPDGGVAGVSDCK